MAKNILVIGGTRFFGRTLVRRLVEAGESVTILTRGLASDPFGNSVRRIRADRRDADQLRRALKAEQFDLVYDQMCYNPIEAAEICNILDGRAGHYIMASTIEAYSHLIGVVENYRESDIDLSRLKVTTQRWNAADSDDLYGAGKRQAEAVIARSGLHWTTVRIGHVLSGPDDFTGRLADYVERARADAVLYHSPEPGRSSFITVDGIVEFLIWLGKHGHWGPFNAAARDRLTALDLQHIVSSTIGTVVRASPALEHEPLTPFDFPAEHSMDTRRAHELGFDFGTIGDQVPDLVRAHLAASSS